jgi:hypothetical protein
MRAGEWLAATGAVGLLVTLCFNWFSADLHPLGWRAYAPVGAHGLTLHQTGWASLGWLVVALLVLLALGGLGIAYMTVRRTSPAWPVTTSVITVAVGAFTLLVLLVRLLTQPSLGAGLPNHLVLVEAPAYLGLLFTALIPAGAWLALADERLDAPESAYTPPPARPIPGT